MKYENITMIGDNDKVRYLLKKEGSKPLVVIGVNPSTANDDRPDATMTRVLGIAERNGYDGFVMLNLYPQRSVKPASLSHEFDPAIHEENLRQIKDALAGIDHPDILLAFGDHIGIRPYLKNCLRDIVAVINGRNPHWLQLGTPTRNGNPRHPLFGCNRSIEDFDIDRYLNK